MKTFLRRAAIVCAALAVLLAAFLYSFLHDFPSPAGHGSMLPNHEAAFPVLLFSAGAGLLLWFLLFAGAAIVQAIRRR